MGGLEPLPYGNLGGLTIGDAFLFGPNPQGAQSLKTFPSVFFSLPKLEQNEREKTGELASVGDPLASPSSFLVFMISGWLIPPSTVLCFPVSRKLFRSVIVPFLCKSSVFFLRLCPCQPS